MFTEENCERIVIVDNGAEYIYNGYVIREEISRKNIEVTKATEETKATYERRILVSVAQRTYAETQLANLVTTQKEQDDALIELAELIVGGLE